MAPAQTPVEEDRSDLHEAIGTLIVTATGVDTQIGLQIIRAISPVGYVAYHAMPVVMGMEIRVKLNLLKIILNSRKYPEPVIKHLLGVVDSLGDLYQKRNEIAHGLPIKQVSSDRYNVQIFKASAKTGFMVAPKVVSVSEIRDWARTMFGLGKHLEDALTDLGFPTEGPTLADVVTRPLGPQTAQSRKARARKPKPKPLRAQPRPRRR